MVGSPDGECSGHLLGKAGGRRHPGQALGTGPGTECSGFWSAARCRCRGGCPRQLPGSTTWAQAGLAALGFRDGGQRVGSDIGAHAPAAFRRQAGGDGALVALAAQGAAQRVHAGGSGRGRCRESHAVQCRAASHGQGVRGYGVRVPAPPQQLGLAQTDSTDSCITKAGGSCRSGAAACPLQPPWGGTRKFSVMRFSARRSASRTRAPAVRAQRCRPPTTWRRVSDGAATGSGRGGQTTVVGGGWWGMDAMFHSALPSVKLNSMKHCCRNSDA